MPSVASGNRILTSRDLVQHLGSTESWWIRQRPRMVKTGLLVKAGRRFIGDLAKIQVAIADPSFWADEPEVAPSRSKAG